MSAISDIWPMSDAGDPPPPASTQLSLDLPRPRRMDRAALIVTEANRAAAALLSADAAACEGGASAGSPASWRSGVAVLIGPAGAGKSHFVEAFLPGAARPNAATLAQPEVVRAMAAAAGPGAAWAFEDLERAWPFDAPSAAAAFESGLFHLCNRAAERGVRLLITARTAPARWPIALADLRSRLLAAPLARIDAPDDALFQGVLTKVLADRGVRLDPRVAAYLSVRLERSFPAAHAAAEALDVEALRRQAPITTALAADVFGLRPRCA